MSHEVFEIVRGLDMKNIEIQLAMQCAPLITGLKISNLLIIPRCNEMMVGAILDRTDISFYKVMMTEEKSTFLLFRKDQLKKYIMQSDAREIFDMEGYSTNNFKEILSTFRRRYQTYMNKGGSFPHELGVLLGYPLEDVKGFMDHDGKEFLHCGYWKVYQDVEKKITLFEKFDYAKDMVIQSIAKGLSIQNIIEKNKYELQISAV